MKDINYRALFPKIIKNFRVKNTSNILLNSDYSSNIDINQVINEIDSYSKVTGIIINNISFKENEYIYFLIFDDEIIILNAKKIQLLEPFFKRIWENTVIFLINPVSKIWNFEKLKIIKDVDNNVIDSNQTDLVQIIQNKICRSIIIKSLFRTQERHNKSELNDQNNNNFSDDDFIQVFSFNSVLSLSFNKKDQYLYILKYFSLIDCDMSNNYEHERNFYENHNNKNPFISRFYGEIKNYDNKVLIIEYIEGQTLQSFIEKNKGKLSQERS